MSSNIFISTSSTDWNRAANWSLNQVPISNEDVYFSASAVSVDTNLDQHIIEDEYGTALNTINFDTTYSGKIGTNNTINTTVYLKIGSNNFNIGTPALTRGTGSQRLNIQAYNYGATFNIFSTATSAYDTNSTPCRIIGSGLNIDASGGITGVAIGPGETSSVSNLNMVQGAGNPTVVLGQGVTLSNANVTAGTVINNSSSLVADAIISGGGQLTHQGNGGYLVLVINSGSYVAYTGLGTISTLQLTGTLDLSAGIGAVTITHAYLYSGAKIIDPFGRLTFTNPISLVETKLSNVSLDFGINRNIQVS